MTQPPDKELQRLSRRNALLVGGGIVFLTAASFAIKFGGGPSIWTFLQRYRYRVVAEVDGRRYDLTNGGIVAASRGEPGGFPVYRDFPMPAVAKLPKGEALVALPPSLATSYEALFQKSGEHVKHEAAPYAANEVPSIFILNDATNPTRVETYAMKAAQHAASRVKVLTVENELTVTDQRISPSTVVPWFAAIEALQRQRADGEVGGLLSRISGKRDPNIFIDKGEARGEPRPGLFAWIAAIYPTVPVGARAARHLTDVAAAFAGPYEAMGQALARGDAVTLALQQHGEAEALDLRWPDDPRHIIFHAPERVDTAWAGSQPDPDANSSPSWRGLDDPERVMQRLRAAFVPKPLGPLTFKPDCKQRYRWIDETHRLGLAVEVRHLKLFEGVVTPNKWVEGPFEHLLQI